MPQKPKIVGSIQKTVLELHSQGHNPRQIALAVGVARDTIKSFLLSRGLTPNSRSEAFRSDAYGKFVDRVRSGEIWTLVRKDLSISYEKARELLESAGIAPTNRNDAAQRKTLTEEQVISRIDTERITFDGRQDGRYIFKDKVTGDTWSKIAGKIARDEFVRKSKLTEEDVVRKISGLGYEVLSVHLATKISRSYVVALCPNGHMRTTKFHVFQRQGCPACSNTGVSKPEMHLLEMVKEHRPSAQKYLFLTRVTRPKEIDVYVPEIKFGIEYCGLYWHSVVESESNSGKVVDKHYEKMILAQNEGIELLTIFDNEWETRSRQIWAYIKFKIGIIDRRFYARNLEVKEISKDVGSRFIDEYHIQGEESASSLYVGLFAAEELISVMAFGRHPRNANATGEAYLNRYAVKEGDQVVGGASKLLKLASGILVKSGHTSVVSWSDNRFSSGNVYKALGFSLDTPKRADGKKMGMKDGSIWPQKYYVLGKNLVSKSTFEKAYASNPKLPRRVIWDCGKKRWVLKIS